MLTPASLLVPSRRSAFAALGLGAGAAAALASRASAISAPPVLHYDQVTNVKNFQAKGDGATDDYQKLQNALNKASTSGNLLAFLPPGNYAISAPLIVPINVSLVGLHSVFDVDGIDDPVTRISALPGFPASQPLVEFATRWSGRFENICIDGANHATCGVAQTSVRGAVHRNIAIRSLGNALGSDYAWLITTDSSMPAASNLYERINISLYTIAAGTNGMVCVAGAGTVTPITENTFISCNFGCGADAVALNMASFCDNNWVGFSNFGSNSNTLPTINFNNQGTLAAQVLFNNFVLCSAVNAGLGPAVRANYTDGAPHTFFSSYLFSGAGNPLLSAVMGTQGKLNCRSCVFSDNTNNITLPSAALAAGASPWTWMNPYPTPVMLNVWGGANLTMSIITNGTPSAIANGLALYTLYLEPGEGVIVGYTVAPAAVAFPRS